MQRKDFPMQVLLDHGPSSPSLAVVPQGLKERRISCLPTEGMIEIFSSLLPTTFAISGALHSPERNYDWFLDRKEEYGDILTASRVCREWRRICLSTASLWSHVWITNDETSSLRAEIFTQRLGNSPSEIVVHEVPRRRKGEMEEAFTGPLFDPVLQLSKLFPEGPSRVKTLRIFSTFPTNQDLPALKWFMESAPILESLAITADDINAHGEDILPYFTPPHPLFGGHTPALRRLSLENVKIPWTTAILKDLTILRVRYSYGHPVIRAGGRVQLDRLLEILRGCPFLVTLELQHTGPTWLMDDEGSMEQPTELVPKVDVRFLRDVTLKGLLGLSVTHSFFTALLTGALRSVSVGLMALRPLPIDIIDDFPPRTLKFDPRLTLCNCISLKLDIDWEWVVVEMSHVNKLDEHLHKMSRSTLRTLHQLVNKRSEFDLHVRFDNGDALVSMSIYDDGGDPNFYRRLLQSFLYRLCPHPESIHALSLEGSDMVLQEMAFEEIFAFLSNVHCIEIWDDRHSIEAESFTLFLENEAQRASKLDGAVAFPTLQMLVFGIITFRENNFSQLCAFLSHRKTRNAEIRYLGLSCRSDISVESQSALQGLVISLCILDGDTDNDSD